MRRTKLLPVAGLALTGALLFAGCTTKVIPGQATPTPTPTPTPTAEPAPTPTPDLGPPTVVAPMPPNAMVQVSVTASDGSASVRMTVTYQRADATSDKWPEYDQVRAACANTIETQLGVNPGTDPVGVLVSRFTADGTWPRGFRIGVEGGPRIATAGTGADVVPAVDAPDELGCAVPVVSGPAPATFASLIIGPAPGSVYTAIDQAIGRGVYGFATGFTDADDVVLSDCVIQLSPAAERLAERYDWLTPAEWGDNCLIGDPGDV